MLSYPQGIALLTSRLTESVETILPGNPYFASNIIWVINCSIIVIILPVINHLVLPFWPNIRIKFKLGVGILLNVISLAVGTFLLWWEKVLSPQQQFCWLVLPAVLFSVAEALVFVSGKSRSAYITSQYSSINTYACISTGLCMALLLL